MCDGKSCPCDVDYEDDMTIDAALTHSFRHGYDAGFSEANARWADDYSKVLSRLAQIRELAR